MRIRSFLALLALASFAVACGDDDPAIPATEDTGAADADSGTDTGVDTPEEDAGPVCEFECLRLSDCAGADLTTPSCVEGCCVEGTPVDPPEPVEDCGDVTFQGECDGSLVRWCQDGALEEIDCAGFFEGAEGTCEFFTEDFGYFCAAPEGFVCFGQQTALCGGEGESGCLVSDVASETGSACTGFEAACTTPEDPNAEFPAYCEGDIAVFSCNVNQPTGLDCAAMGGSCDAGGCVNLQPGAGCVDGLLECANGLECVGEADQLGVCEGEVVDPTCDDGEMNGDEEGIDCGGETCEACAAEATCDDELMNGNESAIDCGGDECDACDDGATCGVASDCTSGVCGVEDSLCAAPACDDGVMNGDEEDVDCGGATCEACEM